MMGVGVMIGGRKDSGVAVPVAVWAMVSLVCQVWATRLDNVIFLW